MMYNIHSIDEEFWGEPDNFRPERFIGADGNLDGRKAERFQLLFAAGFKRNINSTL